MVWRRRPLDAEVAARVVSRQLVLPSLALAKYYQQREKHALDLLEKKERDISEAKAAMASTNMRLRTALVRPATRWPDRSAHCHVIPIGWRDAGQQDSARRRLTARRLATVSPTAPRLANALRHM